MMFGTFPKDFSPSGNFPMVFSQAATSQVFPSRSDRPQPVLVAALGPTAHPSRSARPPLQPAAPQRATLPLESCRLGNCTFFGEGAIWKLVTWEVVLGKMTLGKYLTPY